MINIYSNYKSYVKFMNSYYQMPKQKNIDFPPLIQKNNQQINYRNNDFSNINAISEVTSSARKVQTAAKAFDNGQIFNERKAESTNQSAISATANNNATLKEYKIDVNQLAAAQENEGAKFNTNEINSLGSGTNTFSLTVGGKSKTLSVNVRSVDSNEQVLNKLKDSINSAELGVTARIVKQDGKSQMMLRSNATGTDSAFNISDISGSLISNTGLNNVKQTAQNASYTLNGAAKESQSNKIVLDDKKLAITLNKITTSEETITVKRDVDKIADKFSNVVNGYNDILSAIDGNAGVLNDSLRKRAESGIFPHALSNVGTKKLYGEYFVDKEALKEKLNSDFNGTVKSLSKVTNQLENNSKAITNSSGLSLLNKSSANNNFPYTPFNNIYNGYLGFMFDRYF